LPFYIKCGLLLIKKEPHPQPLSAGDGQVGFFLITGNQPDLILLLIVISKTGENRLDFLSTISKVSRHLL